MGVLAIHLSTGSEDISMSDSDLTVIETMEKYGGSFVVALAQAARRADANNLAKLKAAFPEYWQQYTEMAGLK